MKIITKYYDKSGKLLKIRPKEDSSLIRFKVLKNRKEFPCCDFEGKCTNFAYVEAYPCMLKNSKKKGWNYLCRKHYYQEEKKCKWKLPVCFKVEW